MNREEKENLANELNRRDFLRGGSLATLMSLLGGVRLAAQPPPQPEETDYDLVGEKVKCAVIGLGAWGREVTSTLLRVPQADLVAGCDHYPAFLRRLLTIAPNAKPVEDYRAILDDGEIRAVIIATPTHQHRQLAVEAMQAGKHVYCEAPLAATVEDAAAIAKVARDNPKLVFQAGLQVRSDPQRQFLLPFIRSGALGRTVMARAQWHKKQSWRTTSPFPDREKELNWRLRNETSPGLIGEVGIHQLDSVAWFLNARPTEVTGFGSLLHWRDGRDVPDTVQAVFEFRNGVRFIYHATLANSFDADYEVFYGSDAAVMIRESNAWMFKEVDSPLLGWEVYAEKESFYNETGISLRADATKLDVDAAVSGEDSPVAKTSLYHALEAFVANCDEFDGAVEDFDLTFDPNDTAALRQYLGALSLQPAAGWKEGYEATVMALKANEAILKNEKIAFQKEWFEL